MRQANDCTEDPPEASGHSPAEGPGRGARKKNPNTSNMWLESVLFLISRRLCISTPVMQVQSVAECI